MKILYVRSSAGNFAGSEVVPLNLVEGLGPGHEASVLLPEEGPFVDLPRARGIPAEVVRFRHVDRFDPMALANGVREVHALVRRLRPDIVHTTSVTPIQVVWPSARHQGLPLVCHVQSPYSEQELRERHV